MRVLRWILLALVALVVIVLVGGVVLVNSWLNAPLPQVSGELKVAGLNGRVEVIRDTWGVPHIYASSAHDLFFAQGYTQAQDRWWQMEFARATGDGRIQELTGKSNSLMGTDVFIRKVGWRRAAERDLANLDADALASLQSFADGVNAYINSRPAESLAVEYRILGLTGVNIPIKPWEVTDTLVWGKVMAWDLGGNMDFEEVYSALLGEMDAAMASDYLPAYEFDRRPTIIKEEDLPASGEPFAPAPASSAGIRGLDTEWAGGYDPSQGVMFARGDGIGSNNWVIAGERTASGMPMLANDPHLGIQMPSIWYEIGLHCQPVSEACPYNVRGFTFAPTAGIIIGHNDRVGWGVTNVGWDTQDLYAIKVNPENPLQYEWNGDWRDMTVYDEEIRFGDGEAPLTIQVRETHLGPIINDNQRNEDGSLAGFNNENPLALRWTSYEPGTLFNAVIGLNRAQNWEDFRTALMAWDSPSQNFVYLDVDGNIGYQTPGRVPIRRDGHDGLLPIDGTTSAYEWNGFVPFEYLPSVLNPERGYVKTANEALVPLGYYDSLAEALGGDPANYIFGQYWAYGHRGQRIEELILATDKHTAESIRAIQGDNKLLVAEEIAGTLQTVEMGDATLNELRDWMLAWDYQLNRDSAQAALFMSFWQALMANTFDDQLAGVDVASGGGLHMTAIRRLLEMPDNVWWDDSATEGTTETRDDILQRSFKAGYDALVKAQGSDRNSWAWGKLHTATFVSNPLGASGIGPIEDLVNRGPIETSGGSDVVNATGWRMSDFTVRAVPSMRMILDASDWSASTTVHTTGQSGHPQSAHYFDMAEAWRNIENHPMLWTREQVEANQKAILVLNPE